MNNLVFNKLFWRFIIVTMLLCVASNLYHVRDILSWKMLLLFASFFFAGWSISGAMSMLTMIDLLGKTRRVYKTLELLKKYLEEHNHVSEGPGY